MLAGQRAASALFHPHVILQRSPQEEVVPAADTADIKGGHGDLLIGGGVGEALPVSIVGRMGQPLKVVRSKLAKPRHVHQREMLVR